MTPEKRSWIAFIFACLALAFAVLTFVVRGLLYGVLFK